MVLRICIFLSSIVFLMGFSMFSGSLGLGKSLCILFLKGNLRVWVGIGV